jgi:hypothetical protein
MVAMKSPPSRVSRLMVLGEKLIRLADLPGGPEGLQWQGGLLSSPGGGHRIAEQNDEKESGQKGFQPVPGIPVDTGFMPVTKGSALVTGRTY